eukprot:4639544-Alexandrium_andersonii.AAC.1
MAVGTARQVRRTRSGWLACGSLSWIRGRAMALMPMSRRSLCSSRREAAAWAAARGMSLFLRGDHIAPDLEGIGEDGGHGA